METDTCCDKPSRCYSRTQDSTAIARSRQAREYKIVMDARQIVIESLKREQTNDSTYIEVIEIENIQLAKEVPKKKKWRFVAIVLSIYEVIRLGVKAI